VDAEAALSIITGTYRSIAFSTLRTALATQLPHRWVSVAVTHPKEIRQRGIVARPAASSGGRLHTASRRSLGGRSWLCQTRSE
jgi:hypothetical protein